MLHNCIFCDKQFTLKANLKVHVETVHEGIKIKCDKCDYKTGQKVSLRRHQQSMHGGMRIGFCSIFRGWSHEYGKSGTYSKVCETLVHIPVDFVSTQLK